jgi:glycosyltransferase involved in cell wall biosynthesis
MRLTEQVNKKKVDVSILVPMYNRVSTIKRCIDSALNQTVLPSEIIISDNCSVDGGWEFICREYKSEIDKNEIRVIRQTENVGMLKNWDTLLDSASSRYVKYIFSDDYIASNYLEEAVKIMEMHPNVGILMSSEIYFDEAGQEKIIKKQWFGGLKTGLNVIRCSLMSRNNIGAPTGALLRREVLTCNSIRFCAANSICPDYEVFMQMLLYSDYFFLSKPLVWFYVSGNTETNQTKLKLKWIKENIQTRHRFANLIKKSKKISVLEYLFMSASLVIYSEMCYHCQIISSSSDAKKSMIYMKKAGYSSNFFRTILCMMTSIPLFRKAFKGLCKIP